MVKIICMICIIIFFTCVSTIIIYDEILKHIESIRPVIEVKGSIN